MTSTWTALGPASLSSGGGNYSGRIAGVAVDPTNSNNIYIAAAGGGVWNTTDGGATWTPLTDSQGTLAMGAIAIAPSNHLKIYAGTGEANNSGDSNFGLGILASNDGGATWSLSTGPSGIFNRLSVAQISVDPTNANVAYAALALAGENAKFVVSGGTGVYKTTDGGTTWTNLTGSISEVTTDGTFTSTFSWSSVVVDPNTTSTIYAAHGYTSNFHHYNSANGVYRSIDGGSTWTLLVGPPNGGGNANTGRIALAVAPSAHTASQHVLYVAMESVANSGLLYFGRSDNADATTPTFTDLTSVTPDFLGSGNGTGQGFYDIAIGVDPVNSANVYAAGVVTYSSNTLAVIESMTSGASWTDITAVGGIEPHTDNHAITFDSSSRMLLGNDGGIWRYDPTVPSWTNLNGNLNTIQFTGVGLHPSSTSTIVGGSQDNGTESSTGSLVWSMIDGGDGGFAQISQTIATRWYHVAPVGSFGPTHFFRRSDNSGASWMDKTSDFVNTNSIFYPPFTVDPTNGDHLFIGLDRVYESTTAADGWFPISTPGSGGFPSGTTVRAVAYAPGTSPAVVYAATGAGIYVTTNDGTSWNSRSLPAGGTVNEIDVDPSDATGQTAVAIISSFNAASGQVYRTTTAGATWTNITGNLPAIPTWSAKIDTDANHTIYVSNETGVYSSPSPYTTWAAFGTGLSHAQGVDLELNRTLHELSVATHGRGAWAILTAGAASVTNVTSSKANGTYGAGALIPIQITFSSAVNVTGTPQLALNSGGTAAYSSGTGTVTLTFNYTVGAGQNSALLDYTSTSALTLNGGTITDTGGVAANLTLPAPGAAGSLSSSKNLVINTNATHFAVTAPTTATSGVPIQFMVTAQDASNNTVTSYSGHVHFSSSDASAALPGNTTLTNGVGTFPASLVTVGPSTISATDTVNASITGTSGSITVSAAAGLRFVAITPCRVADTRTGSGFSGAFGPPYLSGGTSRSFPIPTGSCGTFSGALAYSLNVTVVPHNPLGYLTIWPTGQTLPNVSTLNSDGRIKANAAVVPAGTSGAVSVFVTDDTDLILDINGYFVPNMVSSALVFYPLAPCRIMDTRTGSGFSGAFGPPSLTPPSSGSTSRTLPILSSSCGVPSTAQAYSLNFTAIPQTTLYWLTVWPTGLPEPNESTLNDLTGTIVANAAIVPTGTNGSIDLYVTDQTDMLVDINGYFAPPGTGGLLFYPLPPCRVVDTRSSSGVFNGELDVDVIGSVCGGTSAAKGYAFNATVVPPAPLLYLTLWAHGATQPPVSTLNANDGAITSNLAIVPTTDTKISAYASSNTQLILDISGYFAP
jgi:hypothetical protein